jgi:SAM-dependent methyltransferase
MKQVGSDPILWRHISALPYFRGMLRAVEDRFYQDLHLPEPTLDVGCGDGHFASVAFDHALTAGIDPWAEPLREASRRAAYRIVLQADGARMPFADGWFASAISNSVLEHIPNVEDVLKETGRVLRPGGLFVFCVPNQHFTENLLGITFFLKLGMKSASQAYGRFFNRIARHAHTDGQAVWKGRLEQAGFSIIKCWDYFPPPALHVLEAGHFFGLPSLVARKLTGQWIVSKSKASLWLPWVITQKHVRQPLSDQGACTFYITRRNE